MINSFIQTSNACRVLVHSEPFVMLPVPLLLHMYTVIYAGQKLDSELATNLAIVDASDDFAPPVQGCKAVIAPCVSLTQLDVDKH